MAVIGIIPLARRGRMDRDTLADDLREFVTNWDYAWLLRKSAIKDREKSFKQVGLSARP